MALQLQHIFAGKRVRTGKPQRNALIQHAAIAIGERQIIGVTRLRQFAQQLAGDLCRLRARDAQNAYAAASGWRRLGNNGIAVAHKFSLATKNTGGRFDRLRIDYFRAGLLPLWIAYAFFLSRLCRPRFSRPR